MATMNNNNNNKQKQHTIRPQITNIKRPKPNLIKAKKNEINYFHSIFFHFIYSMNSDTNNKHQDKQ